MTKVVTVIADEADCSGRKVDINGIVNKVMSAVNEGQYGGPDNFIGWQVIPHLTHLDSVNHENVYYKITTLVTYKEN